MANYTVSSDLFFNRASSNNFIDDQRAKIHSGHYMISCLDESNESNSDQDQLLLQTKSAVSPNYAGFNIESMFADNHTRYKRFADIVDIDLVELFQYITLSYNGNKVPSPKWKDFKGIKLKLKHKIRLNNLIWREWFRQYIQGKRPYVCLFDTPTSDKFHCKPEAVVLEGKYSKRRLSSITKEYRKWRMYGKERRQMLVESKEVRNFSEAPDKEMLLSSDFDTKLDLSSLERLLMSFDQAFEFPGPRDIAPGVASNYSSFNSDMVIQPGLIQLQPNFDEAMDTDDQLLSFLTDMKHKSPEHRPMGRSVTNNCSILSSLLMRPPLVPNKSEFLGDEQARTGQVHTRPILKRSAFSTSQIPRNEFQFFSSRDDQQSNTFPDLMQNPGKSVGQGIFQSLNFNSSKVKNQDFDVQAHQQSGNLFGTRSTMNYNYANSFAQRTGSPKVFQESANVPEAGHKKFVQVRRDYRRLSGDLSMPQSKQVQKIIAEERLPGRRASTSALQDYIAQRDADIHNAQFPARLPKVKSHSISYGPSVQKILQSGSSSVGTRRRKLSHLTQLLLSGNNVVPSWSKESYQQWESASEERAYSAASDIAMFQSGMMMPGSFSSSMLHVPPQPISLPEYYSQIQSMTEDTDDLRICSATCDTPPNPSPFVCLPTFGQSIGRSPTDQNSETCQSPSYIKVRRKSDVERHFHMEQRRVMHLSSEQKRRGNINGGFDRLEKLIFPSEERASTRTSKAATLQKSVEVIKDLQLEHNNRSTEIEKLKKDINLLKHNINLIHSQMPAGGLSGMMMQSQIDSMHQHYNELVQQRTQENWKFWIFGYLMRPLFTSYVQTLTVISTADLEKAFHTWLDEQCSLLKLRPIVSNELRTFAIYTSIQDNPSKLPEECLAAARNPGSSYND